jgi:hypothetical protein
MTTLFTVMVYATLGIYTEYNEIKDVMTTFLLKCFLYLWRDSRSFIYYSIFSRSLLYLLAYQIIYSFLGKIQLHKNPLIKYQLGKFYYRI